LPDAPGATPGRLSAWSPDLGSPGKSDAPASAHPDFAVAAEDLASPPDMAKRTTFDLASTDLAGLLDCYGVAICNPSMDFCIKYHAGSQAAPGALVNSPACFSPSDTCANQGQTMGCNCIQADANLGPHCQTCVAGTNGAFDCYGQ
jgi:hypothetical protein